MSDANKNRVNVLIVDPADAADFASFGGGWKRVATLSNPMSKPLFAFLRSRGDKTSYHLIVFRR
jgi:hypothetical protein